LTTSGQTAHEIDWTKFDLAEALEDAGWQNTMRSIF
jgi:hypothetical protein